MGFSFNIAFYLFAQEKKNPGCVTSGAQRALRAFIARYFALVLLSVTTSPLLRWEKEGTLPLSGHLFSRVRSAFWPLVISKAGGFSPVSAEPCCCSFCTWNPPPRVPSGLAARGRSPSWQPHGTGWGPDPGCKRAGASWLLGPRQCRAGEPAAGSAAVPGQRGSCWGAVGQSWSRVSPPIPHR